MSDVIFTDNSPEVLRALEQATARALEIIGGKAESYAKGLVPVDTGALRNSLTHQVDDGVVSIGSAINYAPYVELGTGNQYEPPPEWIQNNAPRGAGIISHSVKPRPYLRPAVIDHVEEYKQVVENELKNA